MITHKLTCSSAYIQIALISNGRRGNFISLIDTGASISAIHPEMVEGFEAQMIGAVDIKMVGGSPRNTPTYYFQVVLEGSPNSTGVEVVAATPSSPCDMLIGRDSMSRWVMIREGDEDRLRILH